MINKFIITISITVFILSCYGQENATITEEQLNAAQRLGDLYNMGISMENDSIKISDEFKKLLNDSLYLKTVYPDVYDWRIVQQLLEKKELKKAFWHMLNLYRVNEGNKENILKIFLSYDKILDMNKVLTATFYTYCYQDPEIGIIRNGKPDIERPDILESKLETVKEIIRNLDYNRKN